MKLPEPFVENIKALLTTEYNAFIEALQAEIPVSIRVNDKVQLQASNEQVSWCDSGYYLKERPLFTADPLFHAGAYYVQEASSMFLGQVLKQFVPEDSVVLDLSAAPGGKSTLISQYLSANGFLVSNEIVRSRAYVLAENMIKWGNPNVFVSNNTPIDFRKFPSLFDAVVIDAPCSGEGMFRKDAGAIAEWSTQNVTQCVARQQDIIGDVWDSLRNGGVLIYSTCTYNELENEANVQWIADELGAEVLSIDSSQFPDIQNNGVGCRFFLHKTKGEGFFITALRKTAEVSCRKNAKKHSKKQAIRLDKDVLALKSQLKNPENWSVRLDDTQVYAYPKQFEDLISLLLPNLHPLHYGVKLADVKGKDNIPHVSLALSKHLDKLSVNSIALDKAGALSYLKRENLVLPTTERAYFLLTYESLPIGWVKNLGNRANNLYPSEWRIRMKL